MDLPTCPACGQSVLDDDVEDCPFCGSSMTAAPAKKPSRTITPESPKPASSSQQKTSESESSSSTASVASSRSKTSAPQSDDPFDFDDTSLKDAIPARPRATKTHPHEVICPMCETASFVSAAASGREIRCANPECLAPVFTAPEIQVTTSETTDEAPPKDHTLLFLIVLATMVLLMVGGIAWYFSSNTQQDNQVAQSSTDDVPPSEDSEADPAIDDSTSNEEVPETVIQGPSLDEIERQALKLIVETSRERDRNRSKPFCRRLAAEAYAASGDLDESRQQLLSLTRVGANFSHYHLLPLVSIAWNQLDADQLNEAKKTLDEAWSKAQQLPRVGRYRLDAATSLAAVLVATGRLDDASSLLNLHQDDSVLGDVSAKLQVVNVFETFDLDAAYSSENFRPWASPQWTAVTLTLAAHRKWEAALQWARRNPRAEVQSDCIAEWADALTEFALRNEQPELLNLIETALDDLDISIQVRVRARIAARQFASGQQAAAEESLKQARDLLSTMPVPDPMKLPGMRELYLMQIPKTTSYHTAALSAAEVARSASAMGQADEAWESFQLALTLTRGMAFSRPAIQRRFDEIGRLGTSGIGNRLRNVLRLSNDDQAFRAFRNYQRRCNELAEAARKRFDLQVSLLKLSADWDIGDRVWNEVLSRSQQSDPDLKEPFLETEVPWLLAVGLRNSGKSDAATAIENTLRESGQQYNPRLAFMNTTSRLIADGRIREASEQIDKPQFNRSWRILWFKQLACRLAKRNEIEAIFDFVRVSTDPILREETFQLVSALAAKQGNAVKFWETIQARSLVPTEKVAACKGLVIGILASKR